MSLQKNYILSELPQNHFTGVLPSHTLQEALYGGIETMQKDPDELLNYYNDERTHQGKVYNGRTAIETLLRGKLVWDGKI